MGLAIPGSNKNSDLTASKAFVKQKLVNYLLEDQKSGDITIWS